MLCKGPVNSIVKMQFLISHHFLQKKDIIINCSSFIFFFFSFSQVNYFALLCLLMTGCCEVFFVGTIQRQRGILHCFPLQHNKAVEGNALILWVQRQRRHELKPPGCDGGFWGKVGEQVQDSPYWGARLDPPWAVIRGRRPPLNPFSQHCALTWRLPLTDKLLSSNCHQISITLNTPSLIFCSLPDRESMLALA